MITSDSTLGDRLPFPAFADYEENNLKIFPFRYLYSEKNCFSCEAITVLRKLIPKSDIVHVNGIFTHPVALGAMFSRYYKKPYLVTTHNGLNPKIFKMRRIKKRAGFLGYVRKDLQYANCIHATSNKEMHAIKSMGIKNTFTIIPNGINPSDFENLPNSSVAEYKWPALKDKAVVLFLSRLGPEKGLDLLLPAWDTVKEKCPDAYLVIAGPDSNGFSSYVHKLASQSLFPESIFFTGGVWGKDKLSLYSRAEIFILPSHAENFGIVIAEALACGKPVITTTATPWNDIEKNKCGKWVHANSRDIAKALLDLLSISTAERQQMGQRGKNFVTRSYSWDIVADKFVSVYQSILSGNEVCPQPKL